MRFLIDHYLHIVLFGLCREVPRPWIGLELSDLDIIELGELEKLIHSSPDTLSGVLVRKVSVPLSLFIISKRV